MLRRLNTLPRWLRWSAGLLLAAALLWTVAAPLVAPALLRWAFAKAEAELAGHRLQFEAARFSPWRLALELDGLKLQAPSGDALVELKQLQLNLDALGSIRHRALSLDLLRLDGPRLQLSLQRDGTNWSPLLRALQADAKPAAEPAPPPRLRIALLQLDQGRIDYLDRRASPARSTHIDPLQLELSELSTLPEERGAHQLVARTALGASLRWRGDFGLQPQPQATGELEGDGLELAKLWALLPSPPLAVQAPAGKAGFGLRYAWRAEAGQAPALLIDGLRLQLDGLALQGLQAGEPALRLQRLSLEGGRLDLQRRELRVAALRLHDGQLQTVRNAAGRLDLQDWLPASGEASTPAGPRWLLKLDQLDLQRIALRVDEQSLASPQRLQLASLRLGLALQAGFGGDAAPALTIQGLQAQAQGLQFGPPGAAWAELNEATLEGGELDLQAKRLSLGAIRLQGPALSLQRDAGGGLPQLAGLKAANPATPTEATPWQLAIGPVQLQDGSLRLEDETVGARWQLQALQAELQGLGSAELRLASATARLASGGQLRAQGPLSPRLDLQLGINGLALPPLQPYLAARTPLRLAAGQLDASGRLRLQGQRWSLAARAQLAGLRLDEAGGQPFFAWQRLDAPRLRLSSEQLDLGSLSLAGLQAKLLIAKDKSLNWAGLWKPAAQEAAGESQPGPRLRMERLRLRDARVDFADLSLALPFAARIHGGEGEFVGLDTAAGSAPARLRFEGQVDEFGSAQAEGSLQPLSPTAFSDIAVRFRNVEMVSLTPYTATFAGRRIASGKLDLDLEYRLRDRQLQGDSRVVMQKLTLGEKVDSPEASSLPLDLAIALLEDADGRIDLGLPVSGSLDDPQFSYGGLVWKVIVNVLTKIVTSPFRALGALFGDGQEPADAIAFAPGSARLAPPEREKLLRLAEALAKRPGLALRLSAGFDAARDAEALKTAQLRRALGAADDEQLLDLEQGATRDALLRLARGRLGAAAVDALQQRHAMAQPAPPPGLGQRLLGGLQNLVGRAPAPLSEGERAEFQGKPLGALLWQRLLAAETLAPEALQALGAARAEAAAAELIARGLTPERLRREPPAALPAGDGPLQLPLGAEAMPR